MLAAATATPARAQDPAAGGVSMAPVCPPGNLLRGRLPSVQFDVRRAPALVTDGVVTPEGALWDAALAILFDTSAGTITWDLGAVTTLEAAYAQADANDTYTIFASLDGQSWKAVAQVDPVEGHGLRARRVSLGRAPARFVRFGEGQGDGFFSLSELQVFCQPPPGPPPDLRVENAPVYKAPKTFLTYWNDDVSARWELVLALLGVGLVGFGIALRREGRAGHLKKWRDRALALLGVLAALSYINFGFFHFGNYLHNWEWFHYYTGSKYFKELGYFRLYECVAIADAEEGGGLRRRVELRKLTNLRTNLLETTEDILKHPERCKDNFTAERWQAFKKDVSFFRSREGPKRWDDAQTDHGYNGTPVWNIAGTLLSNLAPASLTQIVALSLLDQAYYAGMIAVVWWAFGWRVLAVGLIAFATNFPSRFYWTGGAFLRWDWLFYTIAAICCLKKERYLLGGFSIGYAALLRIFPALLLAGPALAFGYTLYKDRRLDRRWVRFFAGGALAGAMLVPASFATAGGPKAYVQFVQNTVKHKETPLTNYMGLRTVVAYRPKEVGRYLRSDRLVDPWDKWKQARLRAFKEAKPAYFVAVAAFLVLLGFAVRRIEPWAAAAMGVTFIAVGVELTCYYYAFIIGVALLYEKRPEAGLWALLCTAFTGFVAWAPLPRMSTWLDEQYTLMSVGTVVAFVAILWQFAARPPGVAAAVASGGPDPEAPAPPGEAREEARARPVEEAPSAGGRPVQRVEKRRNKPEKKKRR
jgi:hypothetical protein